MLLAGCAALTLTAQTENLPPLVVPVDAEGAPVEDRKIEMTPQADGTYSAEAVTLDKGFLFEGANDKVATYYALRTGAVTPAVEGLPNPVVITQPDKYIPVEPGTYNIMFDEGRATGYRHFTITPTSGDVRPPQRLFLLVPSGSTVTPVEMNRVDEGVFSLSGSAIPTSFKVAYEPLDQEPYIFGPDATPAMIELAVPVPLSRALNTSYIFTYSPTVRQASDELTVTLDGKKATLLLSNMILTGIEDVRADVPGRGRMFDLTGRPVHADAPAPGLYVDAVTRTLVHVR